jgi:hypothetical protein
MNPMAASTTAATTIPVTLFDIFSLLSKVMVLYPENSISKSADDSDVDSGEVLKMVTPRSDFVHFFQILLVRVDEDNSETFGLLIDKRHFQSCLLSCCFRGPCASNDLVAK